MACGKPLGPNDECSTPLCPYNPQDENKVHEAELQVGEHKHTGGTPEDHDEFGDGGPQMSPEELEDLLNDEDDLPDTEDLEGDFEGDEVGESDKMDISQEDMPEDDSDLADDLKDLNDAAEEAEQKRASQLTEEDKGEDPSDDAQDLPQDDSENEPEDDKGSLDDVPEELGETPDEDGTGDLDDMTDEQVDKLNQDRLQDDEEGHQGGSDEEEEDDGLPPRPRGCQGDCKPGDQYDDDAVPCPHCTAKQFRDQMENEGKQNLPEEQMEQEMQKFLDDWQNEADKDGNGQGDQGDEEGDLPEELEEQIKKHDEALEQNKRRQEQRDNPPDLDDDDLPPRPEGCEGDCQPGDDPDGVPCPHCTTKQFKEEMEREKELDPNLEGLDEDKLKEFWQNFLDGWEDEGKDEEDPPEEELQDGEEPKDEGDGEDDDGPKEFKRVGKQITVTQEKRFDNLVERLEKKVEQMFGQTAEDMWTAEKLDGQFQGEDVSQSIQITSRGVTYWCTLSAAKEM